MKKIYYKKIVTWKQKPDYFGILCCFSFMGTALFMYSLILYNYEMPPAGWILLALFTLMFLYGAGKIRGTLPYGRKVSYQKI